MKLEMLPYSFAQVPQITQRLIACNETSAHFGLVLTETQAMELAQKQIQVLRETGRIEFGEGPLPKLIFAFCDSPFIAPRNYEDTLQELLYCFYYFKGEAKERLSDEELIHFMKQEFDGACQGSVEFLRDIKLEELCHALNLGAAETTPPANEEEGEPYE